MTQDAPAKENQGKSSTALSVALVASEWDSSKGGLSTFNRELATELAQHDQVKVTLLVPQGSCSEEGKRNAESHKVSIREAEKRPGYKYCILILKNLECIKTIQRPFPKLKRRTQPK